MGAKSSSFTRLFRFGNGSAKGSASVRPTAAGARVAELMAALLARGGHLESLSSEVEGDFLKLGDGIERMVTTGGELSGEAKRLFQLAIGSHNGRNTIQLAIDLIRQSMEASSECNARTMRLLGDFRKYQLQVKAVAKNEQLLAQCAAIFTVIRTMFKIEVAPMDEEARQIFIGLTADMERMDRQVQETLGAQFNALRSSEQSVAQIVTGLGRKLTDHDQLLKLRQKTVLTSLGEAEEQLQQNVGKKMQITDLSQGLVKACNRIVMSLQFHDITRQRLQHVSDAVREMGEKYAGAGEIRVNDPGLFHYLHHAGELQTQQIEATLADVGKAEEEISLGFKTIARCSSRLAKEAVELRQMPVHSGTADGIVQNLLEEFDLVVSLINDEVALNEEVYRSVEPLRHAATDLTEAINAISTDIRLIAINAQIQAARIGDGTGLNVLSEQTRVLADQTLEISDTLSGELRQAEIRFEELLEALGQGRQDGAERARDHEEKADAMREKLHDLRSEALIVMTKVSGLSSSIEAEEQSVRVHLGFSGVLTDRLAEVTDLFGHLVAATYDHAEDGNHTVAAKEHIAALKQNYTMASEYSLHDTVVAKAPSSALAAPIADDGLFELFDADAVVETELGAETGANASPSAEIPLPETESATPVPPSTPAPKTEDLGLGDNIELF